MLFSKRRANILTGTMMLLIMLFATACFGQDHPTYFDGMATVKLVDGAAAPVNRAAGPSFGSASLDALVSRFGITNIEHRYQLGQQAATRVQSADLARIYRVTFDASQSVRDVARAFAADPLVEYAEPVPVMYQCDTPDDEFFSMEHFLNQVQAPQAWDVHHCEDGAEVLLGICDSAVEWYHPDLIDNLYQNLGEDADQDGHVIEYIDGAWVFDPGDVDNVDNDNNGYADDFIGWNFWTEDGTPPNNPNGSGINGHGTFVAGMAAGRTDNNEGIASIAWNVKFLPTKHSVNYLTWPPGVIYNAYDGVIYLAEMGCDIINCSWGGDGYSLADQEALSYARSLGCIIVAAAGNAASGSPLFFPASYPEVISVAALRVDNALTDYSNYGIGIDVCAPGGSYGANRVYSTVPGRGYSHGSGTSFSSPMVAGLLALLKSYHPTWTNDQLIVQVLGTADDVDSVNPGYENQMGCGGINAYRALTETNVTVPQELRLELVGSLPVNDDDGDNMLEPGDSALLGLVLRNYAHYVSSDAVTLTLSTNDPAISVTQASSTVSVAADANNIALNDIFGIQVAQNATPHSVELNVQISADVDVTFGQSMSLQLYISPSGVLVWDGGVNGPDSVHYSGEFIHSYLQAHDIASTYVSRFPSSLVGFDTVFLCFGNYGEGGQDYPFTMPEAMAVIEYLEAGGNLYLEGGSALAYYQGDNAALLDALGIEIYDSGPDADHFQALIGMDGTVAEDIVFDRTAQYPRYYLDRYNAVGTGQVALHALGYGDVAVQNEGAHGQKSFCCSYSLAGMRGDSHFSRRETLLARILKFFGYPILEAAFTLECPAGFAPHAPVTVSVFDGSVSSSAITSWAWDFDSDGTIDSNDQNPSCLFEDPGYQAVALTVSDGTHSSTLVAQNCIYLFNGESSIEFGYTNVQTGNATIPAEAAPVLDGAFSIEAWINPTQYGIEMMEIEPLTFLVLDKGTVAFWPLDNYQGLVQNCLCVYTCHNGVDCISVTPSESISLHRWTHVAISYDGQSELCVYIDGQSQELTQSAQPSGPIDDNSAYDLVIGNSSTPDSVMIGSSYIGRIDEVRLWDDVRSQEEIVQAMEIPLTGTEDDLIGYWNMNEAIGGQIFDRSPNNATGTLYGVGWSDGAIQPVVANGDGPEDVPAATCLHQNYPNPFNPTTTISFSLVTSMEHVSLDVYNIRGQRVRRLVNEPMSAGQHSVVWHGEDDGGNPVSSGIYFCRLQAGAVVSARKMLLLK